MSFDEQRGPLHAPDRAKRRAEWRWRNKYVDLIHTKPDYIIAPAHGQWGEPERHAFERLVNARRAMFAGIVVELGSGSGQHLIAQAQRDPSRLFVGFELRFKRAFRTAEKAERAGVRNLVVLQHDARAMNQLFAANTLDGVHINFPDPWSKQRWRKHRLLTDDFLRVVIESLRPEGFLSYKTDHPECFAETVRLIEALPVKTIACTDNLDSNYPDNISTEFESLFRTKSVAIRFIKIKKSTPTGATQV